METIKNKYEFLEQYDFKEIIDKYYLDDSIVSLIFKDKKNVRVLSRISIRNNILLKNRSFKDLDLNNPEDIAQFIEDLKNNFEDHWKNINQINTSIRLPLRIKVKSSNEKMINNFEKILEETDLIYDYYINKFNKNYIIYQVIYNGTPNFFLKSMKKENLNFDIQNRDWILK